MTDEMMGMRWVVNQSYNNFGIHPNDSLGGVGHHLDVMNPFAISTNDPGSLGPAQHGKPPLRAEKFKISNVTGTLSLVYSVLYILSYLNLWVIWHILTRVSLRTTSNVQVFNICLSSYLYSFDLPVIIHQQLNGPNFLFGIVLCKLMYWFEAIAKVATIYFIALASLERYFVICTPLMNKITTRVAILSAGSIWVCSAALMSPTLVYSKNTVFKSGQLCAMRPPKSVHHAFLVYTLLLTFLAPSILIFFCYFRILGTMTASSNRMAQYSGTNKTVTSNSTVTMTTKITVDQEPTNDNNNAEINHDSFRPRTNSESSHQHHRRNTAFKKVTRTILILTTFYLICWLPYWILNVVTTAFVFLEVQTSRTMIFVASAVHILPYVNCALNPLLYALFTSNFREELVCKYHCRCRRREGGKIDASRHRVLCSSSCCRMKKQRSTGKKNAEQTEEASSFLKKPTTRNDDSEQQQSRNEQEENPSGGRSLVGHHKRVSLQGNPSTVVTFIAQQNDDQ